MMPMLLQTDTGEIALIGGLTISILWIIVAGVQSVLRDRNREHSRREIAAYVAEGSMTPEQGEKLLKAGNEEKDD